MNRNLFLTLIMYYILFVFYGCNTENDKKIFPGFKKAIDVSLISKVPGIVNEKILDIKVPLENNLKFDFNKNLDEVHFIKLETTLESKFSNIDKIFITRNRIIVTDHSITKSVFIFDSAGKFINKIIIHKNNKSSIRNFTDEAYCFNTDEIILYNTYESKSSYYDTNGNYKNTLNNYIYFSNFANIKGTDYFVYLNLYANNTHIPVLAKTNIIIGKKNSNKIFIAPLAVPSVKTKMNLQYIDNLSSLNTDNSIFYTPVFSDTVYKISGTLPDVYPKLVFHYSSPNINDEVKKNPDMGLDLYSNLLNSYTYYSFKGKILCTDENVYYFSIDKKGELGYFFSENTGSIIGGSLFTELSPILQQKIQTFRYPKTTYKDYFVSLIPAEEFVYISAGNFTPQLLKLKKDSKISDNPIVTLFKLNKF